MALQNIEEISLKGFIVVKHQLFEREKSPTMAVFKRKVTFSKECQIALDKCQSIQMLINYDSKQIVVKPMSSSDEDSLLWYKEDLKDPFISDIGCPRLTARIYREWKLDPKYRYKTRGRLVRSERKLLLIFDFNEADCYDRMKLVARHD